MIREIEIAMVDVITEMTISAYKFKEYEPSESLGNKNWETGYENAVKDLTTRSSAMKTPATDKSLIALTKSGKQLVIEVVTIF